MIENIRASSDPSKFIKYGSSPWSPAMSFISLLIDLYSRRRLVVVESSEDHVMRTSFHERKLFESVSSRVLVVCCLFPFTFT